MKYKNKEFDKFKINIARNVFLPRDNIFMYQKILERLGADERNFNLLELGTGTGAISISLAKSFKNAEIVATDISHSALKNAKENAKINKVNNRIDFQRSNWFYNLNEEEVFRPHLIIIISIICCSSFNLSHILSLKILRSITM